MGIRLLRSVAAVESICPAWQTLLVTSDCHRAFSSPSWFLASMEVFTHLSPCVWVVEDGGKLLGIAPLAINNNNGQLVFPADLADYQDFVVAKNDADSAVRLLQAVLAARNEVDSIVFTGLRRDSNLCRVAYDINSSNTVDSMCCNVTFPADFSDGAQTCYYADLSDGYEAYLSTRSTNFRSNLRKAKRRSAEFGVEAIELAPQRISGDAVVSYFLRLHLLRFPDKLFSRPQPQQFCRRVLPQLFEQRALRVFALLDQANVVAIHLSMRGAHGLGIWNGGFDPDLSSVSPGKLLINKQIEVCCDEGLKEFDFLRGDEPYKKSWATGCRQNGLINVSNISSASDM